MENQKKMDGKWGSPHFFGNLHDWGFPKMAGGSPVVTGLPILSVIHDDWMIWGAPMTSETSMENPKKMDEHNDG